MDVEGIARRLGGLVEAEAGGAVIAVERRVALSGPPVELIQSRSMGQPRIYLDVETTGLRAGAGTLVVLAGLAWVDGGQAVVRQYVLYDPAAEIALLRAIAGRLREAASLITFNGKRFDQPMLLNRFLLHRLGDPFPRDHLDLLHPARRIWRRRLRSTSLGALEAGVLGASRAWDVPGSEVPARFFEFVRAGDADLFAPVLDHNRQDLVSLILLDARVGQLLDEEPSPGAAPSDLLGLAGLCKASGRLEQARRCYEDALIGALPDERAEALFCLADLARQAGQAERAIGLYAGLADQAGRWALPSAIEAAKLAERARGDPEAALVFARQALWILDSDRGSTADRQRSAVISRISRLEQRVRRHTRPAAASGD